MIGISTVLGILQKPKMVAIGVLTVASLGLYIAWQSSKMDLMESQLQTASDAAQQAEAEYAALERMYDELEQRQAILRIKNKQVDKELHQAKSQLETWKGNYEEAIKNPSVDERTVNTFAERLFLDMSCATGKSEVCNGAGDTP